MKLQFFLLFISPSSVLIGIGIPGRVFKVTVYEVLFLKKGTQYDFIFI